MSKYLFVLFFFAGCPAKAEVVKACAEACKQTGVKSVDGSVCICR